MPKILTIFLLFLGIALAGLIEGQEARSFDRYCDTAEPVTAYERASYASYCGNSEQ